MPPKSKAKKKKGKKALKTNESEKTEKEILTFNEAVLICQLQAKQQQFKDVLSDVEDYERRIARQQERNKVLKEDRKKHLKEAIRQAKEKDFATQQKIEVKYEEVEEALKDKLKAGREEEQKVKELRKHIGMIEDETARMQQEIQKFCDYRDNRQHKNETHIKVLKKEAEDMNDSYAELSEFFAKNLEHMKEQIVKSTKQSIDKEKHIASEQALESMDMSSHQEFSDNKWLRQEVEIHEKHLSDITAEVEDLEKQNIEMMGGLLESQFQDVKITKDFFVACADSDDTDDEQPRPQETEDIIATHGNADAEEEDPTKIDWLDNYIPTFDEDSTEEMMRLTPMDLKMLCVVGVRKEVHMNMTEKEKDQIEEAHAEGIHKRMDWLDKDALLNNASKQLNDSFSV